MIFWRRQRYCHQLLSPTSIWPFSRKFCDQTKQISIGRRGKMKVKYFRTLTCSIYFICLICIFLENVFELISDLNSVDTYSWSSLESDLVTSVSFHVTHHCYNFGSRLAYDVTDPEIEHDGVFSSVTVYQMPLSNQLSINKR